MTNRRRQYRTAFIAGREMNASEIVRWIEKHQGYTVSRRLITERLREGITGEALIAPRKPVTLWPQDVVPISVAGWGFRI